MRFQNVVPGFASVEYPASGRSIQVEGATEFDRGRWLASDVEGPVTFDGVGYRQGTVIIDTKRT
jgi:hypothetical protein